MPVRAGFDVVVVGASIGGCSAARLFALAGARVALIERRPDPNAYKVVCTHQILSSAVPTIERLGLASLIEERGAVRTHAAAWSPYGGWMLFPSDVPYGYGVTRWTLDPILRELAAGTPGVEFLPGLTVVGLLGDDGRPGGVEVETPNHEVQAIRARLVVGADGRGSTVARLARVPGRVRPHNRFFYFAYWRGIRPATTRARLWFLDPDGAAAFPNEDDLTVVVAAPHRSRLGEFRAGPEGAYRRMVAALPDGPDIAGAERASKLVGKLEVPNVMRPAARPGVAFVGDAALATDPSFGVGCGWAFESADWLVDHTRTALLDGGDLDGALERYRWTFRRRLGLEHWLIADMSSGRKLRANERAMFRAAASDPVMARALEEVASRRRSSLRLLDPRLALRRLRQPVPIG
ncbi:MAG TPA: NAD(P)/FAD-dependent oxidoreductase [Solirubrobacteraceae bacterium]|jgi:2-polyprenyl-6-methoxyphenol hydroxylase-like FAD-dependent oxidoreductase|nr:NAD(P)/FAD-dependent oxidoreductase [Solirubrobacteraceae bacterium]